MDTSPQLKCIIYLDNGLFTAILYGAMRENIDETDKFLVTKIFYLQIFLLAIADVVPPTVLSRQTSLRWQGRATA